jgi:6-phosphogluconolactonase (cycloisomerase 2 family)
MRLHVVYGPAQGRELELGDELLIGREGENLGGDPKLSARHAVVRRAGGGWTIEDLGSANGTLVNGALLDAPRALAPGDRIETGGSILRFGDAPQAARRERRGVDRRLVALGILLALLVGALPTAFLVGSSGDGEAFDGVVYVESGSASANSVLALRYRDGSLRPVRIAEYSTGGRAGFDLTESGALDADQQLTLDRDRRLLFAVNQGSDTVAVFRVDGDGELEAVAESPFYSHGRAPASLSVVGDYVVVANKAQDGVRFLQELRPSFAVFRLRDGRLEPVGTPKAIEAGSSPTQAFPLRGTRVVLSSILPGPFRVFRLSDDGVLTEAAGSPVPPEPSIFSGRGGAQFPIGFANHPREQLVYVELPGVAKLAVYEYDDAGALRFVTAVDVQGAKLPCWATITRDGRHLYTANAGNGTVSAFDLSDPRMPRLLQTLKLRDGGNPWGLTLDPTGRTLFVVDPRGTNKTPPARGQNLHALRVERDGTLTEPEPPVRLPVGADAFPIGIAVFAHD